VVYDSGVCNVSYCRTTDPTGAVIGGHPNGDANCDRTANSLDALYALQYDAALIVWGRCFSEADVASPMGTLNAMDAALILQAEAALIPPLPPTLAH